MHFAPLQLQQDEMNCACGLGLGNLAAIQDFFDGVSIQQQACEMLLKVHGLILWRLEQDREGAGVQSWT